MPEQRFLYFALSNYLMTGVLWEDAAVPEDVNNHHRR
jgi:hypothetical protein